MRVLDGTLTIGGLVAFQSLAQNFAAPLNGLVRFGAHLQTIRGDIARLDDVLQYAPDERAQRALDAGAAEEAAPAPRGAVELERVTYGHNVKEEPLSRGLHAVDPAGSTSWRWWAARAAASRPWPG